LTRIAPSFMTFKGLDRDTPLNMGNLVKLRGQGRLPRDHALAAKALTGAASLQELRGGGSGPCWQMSAGRILWRGQFETTLIGRFDGERWDVDVHRANPNAHAFLAD